jgi:hypothetical protein
MAAWVTVSSLIGLMSAGCAVKYRSGIPFEHIVSTLATPRGAVVVYFIDEGALGYSHKVWQQCAVLPGVLAVRRLPDHKYAQSVHLELLDSSRVRMIWNYYTNAPEVADIVVDLALLPCMWSRDG